MYNETFKKAFAESMDERMVLPFLDVPDHRFTKKFERKIKSLFKHPHSYIIIRNRPLPLRKILICVVAALTAIILSVTVAAHWEEIKLFFMEIFSDHSRVTYTAETDFPQIVENIYMPKHIPNGFDLKEKETDIHSAYLYFQGAETYFSFEQYTKSASTNINSELSEVESIKINEYDGYYIEYEDEINLTWVTDEYVFIIWGSIDKDEAVKIAESVINSEQ